MHKTLTQTLSTRLKEHTNISHTRRETLVWLIILIIRHGTVCLWRLAAHVDSPAKKDSVERRLRRFFQYVRFDEELIARLVVHVTGLGDKRWELALDRTNWKFGRRHINILMLGIIHQGVCIPVLWTMLGKAGNSSADERTELLGRLRRIFPEQKILRITGDVNLSAMNGSAGCRGTKILLFCGLKKTCTSGTRITFPWLCHGSRGISKRASGSS
jgi:hypothetical protein